jgi:hypothetical protein
MISVTYVISSKPLKAFSRKSTVLMPVSRLPIFGA